MSKLLRRLAVTAAASVVTATAAVAFTAPAAHAAEDAGCISDLAATNLTDGYTSPTYSPHWLNWVVVDSSGNVFIYTADLISDMVLMTFEWVEWTQVVATNAEGATRRFVACVV